ncbi:MAG: hypothetical protein PF961_18730 [Planctomycetota bacterium]|jgi:hypothetical protein|nr:hypothetical protein [Planctomycetota bacterium]
MSADTATTDCPDHTWDSLPEDMYIDTYGVRFAVLPTPDGGELYLTEHGWALRHHLVPENWYTDKQYATVGTRLDVGTATLYRVPISYKGRDEEFVTRFSRFGQDLPPVLNEFPDHLDRDVVSSAAFNDPFQEFSLIADLRHGAYGPPGVRMLTKRPLGIYVPSKRFPKWQLTRKESLVRNANLSLDDDFACHPQSHHIHIDPQRDYITIYGWIKGMDAQDACEAGLIVTSEMMALSIRVETDLARKGFYVVDNKPRHFIVRQRADGSMLRDRNGRLIYALIDFELLCRTDEYKAYIETQRAECRAGELGYWYCGDCIERASRQA